MLLPHTTGLDYLADDFTVTLRDMWWEMHTASLGKTEAATEEEFTVKTIQDSGMCCGFQPPRSCQWGRTSNEPPPYEFPGGPVRPYIVALRHLGGISPIYFPLAHKNGLIMFRIKSCNSCKMLIRKLNVGVRRGMAAQVGGRLTRCRIGAAGTRASSRRARGATAASTISSESPSGHCTRTRTILLLEYLPFKSARKTSAHHFLREKLQLVFIFHVEMLLSESMYGRAGKGLVRDM